MAKREIGLVVGYATSLVGSVLSLVLFAHALGPGDYGRLAVHLALVEGLQAILFQWHRLAVVKFWASNQTSDFPSYIKTYHLTWVGLTCMVLAMFGVARAVASHSFDTEWPAMLAMGVGKSGALYAQEIARASGAVLRYAVGALSMTIGSAVGGVIAYRETHSVTAILVASTVIFVASSMVCVLRVGMLKTRGRFRPQYLRPMLHYGLPLIPVFVATAALTRLDRPILAQFEPPAIVGVYAAAAALVSNVVSAACLLVVTPAYPWLLREKELRSEDDYQSMHARIGVFMLGGVLAIGTVLYCARVTVLPLLLGKPIGNAAQAYVLPLLAIAIVGAFRAHFFDQAYHLFSKTRALMAINLLTLVTAVAAVYLGARSDGLEGLLRGLLISNVLSLLVSATFSRSFVNLQHLMGGVGLLALVCTVSGFAGELALDFWQSVAPGDWRCGIASASVAMLVFSVGVYWTNVGAIRSFVLRRS